MKPVHVIGAGMTRFGVLDDGIMELIGSASMSAMESASAVGESFDHIVVSSQNPDEFTGMGHLSTLTADYIGLVPAGASRIESGPSSGSSAFEAGYAMIASGLAELVLVVGAEKMSSVERGVASKILAKMMSYENETRYGATPTGLAAMITRRYMHEFGLTRDELSLIPTKAHSNGAKNPYAHFQKEVTVEKVSNARIVADPLTLYDCCPTSDGAAAVILASETMTKTLGPISESVKVIGVGHGTDYHAVQHRLSLTSFNATIEAARKAFEMADIEPAAIDVCELHDAFSILELVNMEDIGLAKKGHAIELVKEGQTSVDGTLPVNTTGGLKARGHPTGGTGVAQIHDIFMQLTGRAPNGLQVSDPQIGLAHNIGGFGNNMVVTLFANTQ
ncbi:MAG: thiolase domain-containing protein [Candidatus Thorarchaeota archaeon]|nr:thiolase domain-containing protein [Candidatus Thorarchaeota archaeon]